MNGGQINCFKFHCPACLAQLPAGDLGVPTAGGSWSTAACASGNICCNLGYWEPHRVMNSLKHIRVEAENLHWGLWLRKASCCCWTGSQLSCGIPSLLLAKAEMPTGTLPHQGGCCDPQLHPEHLCLAQRISGDLLASPSTSSELLKDLHLV